MDSPLAIIGIGCLFPKANGPGAYWANIKNKVDGIGPIPSTHWNPADYFDADPKRPDFTYANRGGFLDPIAFNPAEWGIAPNDLEATDTSQLLALVAAQMALKDAGLLPSPPAAAGGEKRRVSVILGVTGTLEMVVPLGARLGHPIWRKALKDAGVDDQIAETVIQRISDGYVGWQENSFPGLLGNVVAGRVANRLNLGGTNCVVDAACASSLSALHLAGMELQTGRADVVVTGGVDTFNDIFMYMCFSKTPALSPTGDAKPFDAAGDGTILGEGLGVIVLKRLADAERDGDRVYAVVKGIGTSSDGKGNAVYAPSPAGQIEALRAAYKQAGVTPDTVELIEAHGTGTRVGDAAEVEALTTVFRDASQKRSSWCALGSVKSQIGHTKAAAGAAGLIKAALALHHKVLPPTIKINKPLDALASGATPFYVNTESRPWLPRDRHPRRAGVSAFGFGGSNFHCVLEEHRRTKPAPDWDGDVQIVALGASSINALKSQLNHWEDTFRPTRGGVPSAAGSRWVETRARAAESRAKFDPDSPHRLLFILTRDKDSSSIPARARQLLDTNAGEAAWHSPDGIAYGSGLPGKLGFLFPGQGTQTVGMLRDLACSFPLMQGALAEADRAFAAGLMDPGEQRLSDYIYPHPAFTPETRAAQEDALRVTSIAQPALGAVSLGALHVLAYFGVNPEAAAGHSYGELTALCAAGCFDAPSLFELSQLRGRLMAETREDAGAMLAVQAPLDVVEDLLTREKYDLVIANKNGPAQAVLSGRTAEIERAVAMLKDRRVRHVRLPVAAAFHSPLVATASGPFRAALEPIAFHTAQLPVFANSTAGEYPRDPQAARDLLAGQLARPVEFVDQIRNMAAAGVRTFLEVGPGSTLTKLVESILDGQPHAAVAIDASAGKQNGMLDLAHALARLAALGHSVRLAAWDEGAPALPPATEKPTLTVSICGANYRKRKAPNPPAPFPKREGRENQRNLLETSPPSRFGKEAGGLSSSFPLTAPLDSPMADTPLSHALQVTQESLAAFQRMQEQTAQLHRQFLETQESAQRTLQVLVEGQQRLLAASLGLPVAAPPVSPAPEPPAIVPQAMSCDAPSSQVVREPAKTPIADAPGSPEIDDVLPVLLAIVADKTGYPPEMIDPDMGLDADLGIDSIKRVEILSALQEQLPDAPAVKPEHLGTLLTLRQIAEFLCQGERGASATGVRVEKGNAPVADASGSSGLKTDNVLSVLLAIVADKTGYPPEMIDPDMGLDADLGIDSIKRVEILSALQEQLPNAPAVKPEHLGTLQTLRQIAEFLCVGEPGASATGVRVENGKTRVGDASGSPEILDRRILCPVPVTADRSLISLAAAADIWLVADAGPLADAITSRLAKRGLQVQTFGWDDPPASPPAALGGLVLLASNTEKNLALRAFRWLRQTGPALRQSATAVLATVTRLDGAFGLSALGPLDAAESGALAGLTKTARLEWPTVAAKALDLDPALDPTAAADAVVDELFLAGPAEIGIGISGRVTLELVSAPLAADAAASPMGPSDVIVLTGGARGVTAEVAVAFAAVGRPTLVLLGRNPAPAAEPAELVTCVDETGLKRALAGTMPGAAPRQIAERCSAILAGREIRRTLDRVAAAGARAEYHSVDVRDAAAVRAVLAQVRRRIGPITGIVHGAGVLADRRIDDQSDEQFDAVYSTKVAGLKAILAATEGDPLKLLAAFSSSTGRFGRAGQIAYAAANEAVNKLAQAEARRRPECRVAAVNWGPWEGGMVGPALRSVFAAEGIGLIPLAAGARHLLGGIVAPDRAVETVVLGPGSALPDGVHTQRRVVDDSLPVALQRELTLDSHPVLRAHVIDGRAVLPMALTVEWLAHAALHGNPGLTFHGFDDLRIYHPVTVHEGGATPLRVHAARAVRRNGLSLVVAEIRGQRPDGREVVHSRAEIILAADLPAAPAVDAVPVLPAYALDPDDVYQRVLFHGPELRGIDEIIGSGKAGIVVIASTAPAPSMWVQQPLRGTWLADPLVLDCAFQAMSIWCHAERGAVSLPSAVCQYRQYVRRIPAGTIKIICRVAAGTGPMVRAEIDFVDAGGKLVARMNGFECVLDTKLNAAFRRNRLVRTTV